MSPLSSLEETKPLPSSGRKRQVFTPQTLSDERILSLKKQELKEALKSHSFNFQPPVPTTEQDSKMESAANSRRSGNFSKLSFDALNSLQKSNRGKLLSPLAGGLSMFDAPNNSFFRKTGMSPHCEKSLRKTTDFRKTA